MYKVKILMEHELEILRASDEGEAVIMAEQQIGFALEDLNVKSTAKEASAEYMPAWRYIYNFFKGEKINGR
jgi:hypothetical protein